METIVILDTSVLLEFLVGRNKVVVPKIEELVVEAKAALSVISVFELLRGVESEKHLAQRKELIGLCTVLDLTPSISEHAGRIYTYLKKNGSLIHMEDILIAATALHWHYSILTLNSRDFSRIPGVKIE